MRMTDKRSTHTRVHQHPRVSIPRQHNDIVDIELSARILVTRTARRRHVGTHGCGNDAPSDSMIWDTPSKE
jgi:hypothetical protein